MEDIYDDSRRESLAVARPTGVEFCALKDTSDIVEATRTVAERLRQTMEPKSAKPGIVFAFTLTVGRRSGFGIIKADLEDERRFYLNVVGAEWNIAAVQDILPPPQTKYAKYAIVPRPRGVGDAGVRDNQADTDSAADYFLETIGVQVPRAVGTKSVVAQAALRANYSPDYIETQLGALARDEALEQLVGRDFPDISDQDLKRIEGTPQRPLQTVRAGERLWKKYATVEPHFELEVDETVSVVIEGSKITITLPQGVGPIIPRYVSPRE
jgi:hypothetical protein